MRILMLDNEFPPLGGGMGTVNQALLNCYAHNSELEIDLITSGLGGGKELERFSDRINLIKVPVWNRNIHHSTARELILYATQALWQAFKLHRERAYDLCLAWSTVPGVLALALQKVMAVPYIVWISGPDIPGFEQRYRYIYPLLSPAIRSVWTNAASVVAKCAGEIEMISSLHGGINVDFIPNGVDLALFAPSSEKIPDTGPLHVICVARLIKRKGQGHLIDAVKLLSDSGVKITVSLVGEGDSRDEYEKKARHLGIDDLIRFVGYVPREEIARYYGGGHIFVLPSYNEGMALAVLEAMAVGLPIVVTRTGGTIELVEDGVNGFIFDWGDVEGLAKCLLRLNADRALARNMADASRVRALNFSWDNIAERFLELFHNHARTVSIQATKSCIQ